MALDAKPEFGERGGKALLEQLVRTAWEGHAWHFDHVVAVKDGGGACTVENGQTLCVLCHKKRTAEQKKRWAEERRRKRTRVEDEPAARHDDEKRHEKRPATDERPATADPVEIIIDEDDEDDEDISETESEGEARDARRNRTGAGHAGLLRRHGALPGPGRRRARRAETEDARDGRVSPLGRRKFAGSHERWALVIRRGGCERTRLGRERARGATLREDVRGPRSWSIITIGHSL